MDERTSTWATAGGAKEAGARAMTADIRTAAQREAEERWASEPYYEDDAVGYTRRDVRQMMRGAFVQGHESGAARVTPTREQIADEMKRHHFNANRLDNQTWGMWMAECDCGWWSPEFHYPGESIDAYYAHAAENVVALMAGLAEGEHDG